MANAPGLPKDLREYNLAMKLQGLRASLGKTQKEVAQEAGIDESTVRNYELARRTPSPEHLPGLARALEVMPETLVTYDFEDKDTAAELYALIQLAETYGLEPQAEDTEARLVPTSDFMTMAIDRWAVTYADLCKNEQAVRKRYEQWKDNFHEAFEKADFPRVYPDYDPMKVDADSRWKLDCFASRLKQLRDFHGITQDDLAKKSGISKFTIRSYEQGKRLPRDNQVEALARAFEINPSSLLSWFFGSPNQAVHALFKLCTSHNVYPAKVDGRPALKAPDTTYGYGILKWAEQKAELNRMGKTESATKAFQMWLAGFDPDSDETLQSAHAQGLCLPIISESSIPKP